MLSEQCKSLLQRHVGLKGRRAVWIELNISSTTLSQILNDKYPSPTVGIESKIMRIYGNNGTIDCPVLGEIEPATCVVNSEKAQKIKSPGNPNTLRLYVACRKCELRG